MGATVDWLESRNAGIEFNGVLKIETDLRNDLKANWKGSAPGLPYSSAHRSGYGTGLFRGGNRHEGLARFETARRARR